MKKIELFGYVIRTTKSLEEKLKFKPTRAKEIKMWYYIKGIRATSFLGLVRYKLRDEIKFNEYTFNEEE